jgi:hypothetical protein
MIVLAHIMGIQVEEGLVPLASGAGSGMVIWFAAVLALLRKQRDEVAKR